MFDAHNQRDHQNNETNTFRKAIKVVALL